VIRVLVADDDSDVLLSTCDLLELLGFEAIPVNSAGLIQGAVRDSHPDIILQDVQMPGLDLEGLVASLRSEASTRDVPVFLFTASVDADETVRRVGANGAVRKPFDGGKLKALIDRAVAHTHA
jgi:CheY-like chemotaxis protein